MTTKTTTRNTVSKKKVVPESVEEWIEELTKQVEEMAGTTVVESKKSNRIMWDIGWTVVTKPRGRIMFEAQVAPIPMFKLPIELQRYLRTKGFGTNVWRRPKEWLEKHWADMEMIEKLKDFLAGEYDW